MTREEKENLLREAVDILIKLDNHLMTSRDNAEFSAWVEDLIDSNHCSVLEDIKTDIQTLRNCSCTNSDGIIDDVEDIIDKYKALEQEPKTGYWILQPSNKEQGERDFIWWKCSECGQVIFSETEKDRRKYHAFCSRCGAKMQ